MQKRNTKILSIENPEVEVNRLSEYVDLTAIEGNLALKVKGESASAPLWLEAEDNENEQEQIVIVAEEEEDSGDSEEEASDDDSGDAAEG